MSALDSAPGSREPGDRSRGFVGSSMLAPHASGTTDSLNGLPAALPGAASYTMVCLYDACTRHASSVPRSRAHCMTGNLLECPVLSSDLSIFPCRTIPRKPPHVTTGELLGLIVYGMTVGVA